MAIVMKVTDWQYDYINADEKNLLLMAGRRAGKSAAIKCRMVKDSMMDPGHRSLFLTPSGTLCDAIFTEMRTDKYLLKRVKKIEKQPMRKIIFNNGSVIDFNMFDDGGEKVRGLKYHSVYFDEIQTLNSLKDRDAFLSVLVPLVADYDGVISISGQYRGKNCWWYKLYQENKDNPDYKMWSLPSWEGWLFHEQGEQHPAIQRMKQTLPKAKYEQEVACIPAANQLAVFRPEDLQAIKRGQLCSKPDSTHEYVCGCDLGRTVDPSFWVVFDLNTATVVHAEERPLGERHEIGAQKLGTLCKKYNNCECFVDTTGGATGGRKVNIDAYLKFYRQKLGNMRPVQMQLKNKNRLIENLQLAIENNEISIPKDCIKLIEELEDYELNLDSWGNPHYAGLNGHDDGVVALALAYEGYRISSYG